jgi:hypothetical protein
MLLDCYSPSVVICHLEGKLNGRAVGRGVQPVRLHRAPSRGSAKTGEVKKYIINEGALFKHVAQGAKMPSYGPAEWNYIVSVCQPIITYTKACRPVKASANYVIIIIIVVIIAHH